MAPIGAMAAIRAVARHSLLTSLMRGSRSGCYSSSIWGSGRNFRNFMNSSSSKLRFPGSGHELQGCPSGRAGALLILARKKSGFAELFMNRRSGEQEKQVDGSRIRRPPLKRGKVSPRLEVPKSVPRPPYVDSRNAPAFLDEFQIQDAEGIKFMRASGQLAARVRDFAGTLVKAGVTTDEIDKAVHQMIIDAGAYPSPLGYGGFPKSVCTSVNECICHGIPDSRPLEDGDIVNVDVTVYLNVTKESLDKAISICGPGVEFKKIGRTINEIADKHGYGVVEHFVGHGVGKVFHSAPSILHNQPMLTEGSIRDVMWNDNWTCVTEDGGLSAQFEHSLLITESGVEILTL